MMSHHTQELPGLPFDTRVDRVEIDGRTLVEHLDNDFRQMALLANMAGLQGYEISEINHHTDPSQSASTLTNFLFEIRYRRPHKETWPIQEEPMKKPIERQDFATNIHIEHGDQCCGCLELVVNLATGRVLALCNECGVELGSGHRRDAPSITVPADSMLYLDGRGERSIVS